MQIKGASAIDAFLREPDERIEAVLLYGRDLGLVRERSKVLESAIVGNEADPFRRIEMSEAEIKGALSALYEEAAAFAMLGGRKFIRVRMSADLAVSALAAYLAAREAGAPRPDAMIAIEAGDLRTGQPLRKAGEASPLVAVIACYPDDDESLDTLIDDLVHKAGCEIAADAKASLIERLGADRGISRQEIEKLIIYCGAGTAHVRRIETEDVLALIGDAGAAELDRLIDAVCTGDLERAAKLSARLKAAGIAPVRILRALALHLDRLASSHGESAGPRGFYGYAGQAVRRHLTRWSPQLIGSAQSLLIAAETQCKTTGLPADEICERTLLALTRGASRAPAA